MLTQIYRNYDVDRNRIHSFIMEFGFVGDKVSKTLPYYETVRRISQRQQTQLVIRMDDVFDYNEEVCEAIYSNTRRYQQLFEEVVEDLIMDFFENDPMPVIDALDAFIFQRLHMDRLQKQSEDNREISIKELRKNYPPQLLRRYEVVFQARSTDKILSVRDVRANYVGKLVTIAGVVIRATEVKPKASVITFTCDTCACETYQPVVGPAFMPVLTCPSQDCTQSKAYGRLQMQVRGSKFVKFQELRIQEMNDEVPVGNVPRSITVNVFGEVTRLCTPGDYVRISGVFVPLLRTGFKQISGGLITDTYLEAYSIQNFNLENSLIFGSESRELTEDEIELAAQDGFYDLLAHSIAPEIYGHSDVKKSLLLSLVSGVDRAVSGMKVRGCINTLLMGDPGVAKSQLLSYVDRLALRSQYTTGRGSSGVGLTAAVMKDPITGEMVLEGGALVLADQGICCIDEFDKMLEGDRTAIHEVLEQQTISIAKAGINTTLNARVSIIAAANPAYGRYNAKKTIEQNIDLPAALLSRFDLIWLIQDKPDHESDLRLAEHITFVHMNGREPDQNRFKPLDMRLMRRYIASCKRKTPLLDQRLKDRLIEKYVEIRREARVNKDSLFTSPRSLLAVIRMATALARLRLSSAVQTCDIEEAIRLFEASKSSLRAERKQQLDHASPIDKAFAVIRELYYRRASGINDTPIAMSDIIGECASRGIDASTVDSCIEMYTANGIIFVDPKEGLIFTIS